MDFFGLDLDLSIEVYVPREDTFLLVKVLGDELRKEDRVLDMGTGTGILSMVAAKRCKEVVGVDINKEAINLAAENASKNGLRNVEFVCSDLFENVDGEFDLVVFNPPYLPGNEDEEQIEGSEQWFGGEDGLDVIRRFSEDVGNYLSKDGRILLLVSSLTDIEKTRSLFSDRGFQVEVKAEKKIPWETLYVLLIS